jgi:membrane fusion protein, multidrug efflux system
MLVFRQSACLGLLSISAILAAGCAAHSEADTGPTKPIVRFVTARNREVTDYAYYDGRTKAQYSVDIKAQVTGYLKSVDFVAGAEVKKDQRLFKIDPVLYQAAYDQVMGEVELAKAKLDLADADLKRAKQLSLTPGAISQQDVDTRIAAQRAAVAGVVAATANSESAKENLKFTDVLSPFDGVVDRTRVDQGNLVNKDTTSLTTVVSQSPIYVYFDVDEPTLLRAERLMREGKIPIPDKNSLAPVEMGLSDQGSEYPQKGKIDFVSNQLSAGTGTIEVRGVFENPKLVTHATGSPADQHHLLRPNLFVRVRLPLGARYNALVVPQAAIGTDQGLKYVLVVDEKGTVEYRPVTLGAEQSDGWQVVAPVKMVRSTHGLRPLDSGETTSEPTVESLVANDRVIVGGLQQVRPGMAVDAKPISSGEPLAVAPTPLSATMPSDQQPKTPSPPP